MAAIERTLAPPARFNDAACALGKYAGLSLIALMTAAILLQVFFRYVLGSALTWSEEVARFMMVWMTFLVAPIAYRGGANVALDILVAQLGGRPLALLRIVINVLVIGFVLTFFFESFGLIGRGIKMKASTIDVPMAAVYAIIPVTFVAMFTVGIELIGRAVQDLIDPTRRCGNARPVELAGVE